MSIDNVLPTIRSDDHIRGPVTATLVLIVYGSYQCPRSRKAHQIIERIRLSAQEQFCYIYRHFPQSDRYPQALKAAESAEAASTQGKFWEMHDKLFDNYQRLDDASLVEYADEIGLDIPQFLRELGYHIHSNRIQADVESAKQFNIAKLPVFFIDIQKQKTGTLESLLAQILRISLEFC